MAKKKKEKKKKKEGLKRRIGFGRGLHGRDVFIVGL